MRQRDSDISWPNVIRHGVTVPYPRGMNRETSPGKLPPDQFYLLQNVRIKREILSRGGQEKVTSSAITATGCIDGLFDDGNPQA